MVWAVLGSVIAIFIGFWYLTAGTYHLFTPYSTYYDMQADAYLAGQLSLLEEPPDELAKLANVFDPKQREGINYLWDASYYNGKYFLCWGPVPALVAAAIKIIKPGVVDDQLLTYLFYCGLTITMAGCLHVIRKTWFQRTPSWTVFLFTTTSSLCTPVFFLINRPRVYETAIMAAQFFLFLGLYGILRGFLSKIHKTRWFVLAGFGLGASVCSRFTYMFAVLFISVLLLYYLGKQIYAKLKSWPQIIGFVFPMLLFGIGLCWYNYSRFGSIFESGLRYVLTVSNIPNNLQLTFSFSHFIPNIYLSLFRTFELKPAEFPYLFAPNVLPNMLPKFIYLPSTYWLGEPVVGVFASIPFLWTLILPVFIFIKKITYRLKRKESKITETEEEKSSTFLIGLLSGTAIILFATLMLYMGATLRYLVDFTPIFILLASLVTWQFLQQVANSRILRNLSNVLVILLCSSTIVMSLLFNLFSGSQRFAVNNPDLYFQISGLFTK